MPFQNLFFTSIISLIYLSFFSINCYFEIPFETVFIKDKTQTESDYYTNLTQSELVIKFNIGSKEENIQSIIKMDKYGFLIYEDAYNYNKSQTYESFIPDYEDNMKTSWVKDCKEIPSKDNLFLSIYNSDKNTYEQKRTNKTIFLRLKQKDGKNINFNEMFYKYGIIGLKFNSNPYFKAPEFVKSLKNTKDIINNTFFFTFDKTTKNDFAINNNKGKFFVGRELDLLDDSAIKKEMMNSGGELYWGLVFDHIYVRNNKDKNHTELPDIKKKAQIVVNYPYIKVPNDFFEYLNEKFFNALLIKNICQRINFTRNDIYLNYSFYSYACDSESNVFKEKLNKDFPEIIFEHKEFNEYFTLTKNDLFAYNSDNDKNLYFLLITGDDLSDWIFGIPFLKKYVLSFNYDNKVIGYYADFGKEKQKGDGNNGGGDEESFFESIAFKVSAIILLVIVIFIFGMIFQKYYKKSRKKKANELDDDFDYEPHKEKNEDNKKTEDNNDNVNKENNDSLGINE